MPDVRLERIEPRRHAEAAHHDWVLPGLTRDPRYGPSGGRRPVGSGSADIVKPPLVPMHPSPQGPEVRLPKDHALHPGPTCATRQFGCAHHVARERDSTSAAPSELGAMQPTQAQRPGTGKSRQHRLDHLYRSWSAGDDSAGRSPLAGRRRRTTADASPPRIAASSPGSAMATSWSYAPTLLRRCPSDPQPVEGGGRSATSLVLTILSPNATPLVGSNRAAPCPLSPGPDCPTACVVGSHGGGRPPPLPAPATPAPHPTTPILHAPHPPEAGPLLQARAHP
jgi:hypothetical protein